MVSRSSFLAGSSALTVLLVSWLKKNSHDISTSGFIGTVVGLIGLQFILMWCYKAYIYPHYFSPFKDIPWPSGYSRIRGHAFGDIGKSKVQGTSVRNWIDEPNNGLIRFMDLFHSERLMPVSAVALQEVLATKCYDFEKPYIFKTGGSVAILGDGILLAEGDIHKMQRKQLNPAFHYRHIKDLYPIFWKVSMSLIHAVEATRDKDSLVAVIEPNEWASRATLDILGEAGFGLSFDAIKNPNNKVANAYRDLFTRSSYWDIALGILEVLIPGKFVLSLPAQRNRKIKTNTGIIREACAELIREKQNALEKQGDISTTDILSALLSQSDVSFTESEMVEQLVTFLVAGHETTAAALSWAILACCKNPEVQRRLREEICQHIPESAWDEDGSTVSAADLDKLPYLQAFCNEILRFYPPVPGTVRSAAVDTTVAGYRVPKGTVITLSPWAINVSTELWGPDAREFRPERWLESPSGGCTSNYANMTFIQGPRSCIGSSFAKSEFQCLVAAWVGRFESSFAKDGEDWKEPIVDMRSGISARPTSGWKVAVKTVER